MAKLATQTIIIQISKAVSDKADDNIVVLEKDAIDQLREAVEALAGDENGLVVELVNE